MHIFSPLLEWLSFVLFFVFMMCKINVASPIAYSGNAWIVQLLLYWDFLMPAPELRAPVSCMLICAPCRAVKTLSCVICTLWAPQRWRWWWQWRGEGKKRKKTGVIDELDTSGRLHFFTHGNRALSLSFFSLFFCAAKSPSGAAILQNKPKLCGTQCSGRGTTAQYTRQCEGGSRRKKERIVSCTEKKQNKKHPHKNRKRQS